MSATIDAENKDINVITTCRFGRHEVRVAADGLSLVGFLNSYKLVSIDSSIFRLKGNDLVVFLYLLTHADAEGVCDTSYAILSHELGLSVQSLRTITNRLRATGEIVSTSTNKITHVTICNYESYVQKQLKRQQAKSTLINKQNSKENSELVVASVPNIADKLEKDRKEFYNSLIPYVQTYGKAIVREFYDYWTETNTSMTKMKFQLEKTWNTSMRISRWARNNNHINGNNYGRETITDKIRRTVEEANKFSEQQRNRIGQQAGLDCGDNDEVW